MTDSEERRNPKVQRVKMTTLVEICTQDGKLPPFQAESSDLSGRGMQLRTSHLPEIGEVLLCRFEHEGREILVEGKVAWRSEGEESGEFGVQFTALDADSAAILASLRAPEPAVSLGARSFLFEDEEEAPEESFQRGDKVQLHIEGLGAPMKACVHEGSPRKLQVKSQLEFLRMGRALRVEGSVPGSEKLAQVDHVNVVINPSTSVPELVVLLRYEGVSPTPAPAECEEMVSEAPPAARPGARPSQARTSTVHTTVSRSSAAQLEELESGDDFAYAAEDEEQALPPAAEALRQGLGSVLKKAGSTAKLAGVAALGAGKWAKGMAGVLGQTVQRAAERAPRPSSRSSAQEPASRRRTSPAPQRRSALVDAGLVTPRRTAPRSSVPSSARPVSRTVSQFSRRSEPEAELPPPSLSPERRRWASLGAAAAILGVGSVLTWRALTGVAAPPSALAQPPALAAVAPADPSPAAPTAGNPNSVVAQVPMFGAQNIAQGAPPADPNAELSDAEAERQAAAVATPDESFQGGSPKPSGQKGSIAPATSFAQGELSSPSVHRIRLDGPGQEINGVSDAHGFTVLVPGRKALESGRSIEKRDRRLNEVKASNTAEGARVRFDFKGQVPGYKLRLREDFLEIFLSAPADGVAQL